MRERMVSRRQFLRLGGAGLALSAGLPLIAACGDEGGGSGSGSGLTATYMKSGTYDVAAEKFAGEFANRDDTSVDIRAFPYAALRQNNTNAVISGGCDFNVVSGSYYLASIYNYFRPLDDLAKGSDYSAPLAAGLWDQSEFYDGQHVGVPYGPDAYALMYRTDLWEEAGLSWPKTWEEFLAALEALESRFGGQGVTPFVMYGGATEQLPAMLFATYDGRFMNGGGKFELDASRATESIKFAERLLEFAPDDATALSIDEANTLFTEGNAAVLYGWPSFVLTAADDTESSQIVGKWQVGADPQPGFVWLSLWQMYMTKCTEDPDTAWQWMSFWSEPENDRALFTQYGVNPVLEATYQDEELLREYAHYLPGEQKNLARAMNPPLTGEAQDFLASTLGEVFTGETSAEEAVRGINEEWAGLDVPESLRDAAQRNGLVA